MPKVLSQPLNYATCYPFPLWFTLLLLSFNSTFYRLFHRTTRNVTLTSEGELFLQQCLRVKYELDTANELVTCLHQKPSGTLKISCNPTLSDTYLLPKLIIYRKKFPDVDVEIMSEERMPDMKQEQIDLVFGVNWPPPEDIVARKIGTTRYILCASQHYLKKHGTPHSLEDLEKHFYIPHNGRDRNTPIVSLKKSAKKLKLNTPLCANNILFIKNCVMKGLGIAQFHDYIVEHEIRTGKLT